MFNTGWHRVSANILKNNAKTVYVQSDADNLGVDWSSQWNDYHTGDVVYSATPQDSIKYREICDAENNTIGYEICEEQTISTCADSDVVIYNAYRPDESSPYLPVLNICQTAFSDVTLKSLTIKALPDGESEQEFNHAINIRSNAFFFSFIESIDIETDITLDHPVDLQTEPTQNSLGEDITGDENGHSIGVFEESSYLKSVTLPSSLQAVCDKMFYNCTELKEIKIAEQEYDGTNKLPDVTYIGDGAFTACGCLENIVIPSSVAEMGSSVFFDWGTSVGDNHERIEQTINIDLYETKLPAAWSEEWDQGIYKPNVPINFKASTVVTVDLCKDPAEFIELSVFPDEQMPEIAMPTYNGYCFKGIFSARDGNGVQYYTSECVSARKWQEGDHTTLYAYWVGNFYTVTLERDGQEPFSVRAQFGSPMPAASMPTKRGYAFCGYYYPEENGEKTFYYNDDMSSAKNWDIAKECTLCPEWEPVVYSIIYINLLDGYNPDGNPTSYTVESDTITFVDPYGKKGYWGSWDIPQIPAGSVGNKVISAIWRMIDYYIMYVIDEKYVNPNDISLYNIESDTIIFAPPYGREGYEGSWDIPNIPKGSTESVTVTAQWTPIQYNIIYDYGVDKRYVTNPNPSTITCEQAITLECAYRSGYMLIGWKKDDVFVGSLRNVTDEVRLVAVWSDGYVVNASSDMQSLTISVDNMTINMPTSNFGYSGLSIAVNSDINTLTIVSNNTVFPYFVNIYFRTRNSDFTLNLNKVKLISRSTSSPTISMSSNTLYLNTIDECAIYGCDGANRSYPANDPFNGGKAISCNNIIITRADNLTIKGGKGGSDRRGGNGACAIYASGSITVTTNNVKLIGGDGGNATFGGTAYGLGSDATNKPVGYSNNKVTITKGKNGVAA